MESERVPSYIIRNNAWYSWDHESRDNIEVGRKVYWDRIQNSIESHGLGDRYSVLEWLRVWESCVKEEKVPYNRKRGKTRQGWTDLGSQ